MSRSKGIHVNASNKYDTGAHSFMGFIELFFKGKQEVTSEEITIFVAQRIEENSSLEYKDIRMFGDADKLANSITSFANSEGGLLILGVSQDQITDNKGKTIKIYPKRITWGEKSLDKETLERARAKITKKCWTTQEPPYIIKDPT